MGFYDYLNEDLGLGEAPNAMHKVNAAKGRKPWQGKDLNLTSDDEQENEPQEEPQQDPREGESKKESSGVEYPGDHKKVSGNATLPDMSGLVCPHCKHPLETLHHDAEEEPGANHIPDEG
jgi:hypothetical protein